MPTLRPPALPALALPLVLALVLAACGPDTGTPAPSASPAPAPPDSPQAAMDAVRARSPLFDGLAPRDPQAIGQAGWWEAEPVDPQDPGQGWRVRVSVGWGDCPAGCIDRHTWVWAVGEDGQASLEAEEGTPLPEDVLAALQAQSRATGVGGIVTAGPTCPVERPGDPACAPRPVAGASLAVRAGGDEVATFTTDGSGLFRIPLPPGEYTLEAAPVEGLMAAPAPQPFRVVDGGEAWLSLDYDTGIR